MRRKCGDVNGDGAVSMSDYYAIKDYIETGTKCANFSEWAADVNGDGIIDKSDAALIVSGGPFHCREERGELMNILIIAGVIIIAYMLLRE